MPPQVMVPLDHQVRLLLLLLLPLMLCSFTASSPTHSDDGSTHQYNETNATNLSKTHLMGESNSSQTDDNKSEAVNLISHPNDYCWFDKNATRGDFHCSSKTCYNFQSASIKYHRVYCERFQNRVERLDERSKRIMRKIREPMEKFNQLLKTSLRDWIALKFLDFLSKRMGMN